MLDLVGTVAVSPLFRLALSKGPESSILLHLRRGAAVNGRDASGRTPLMIAAALGREDICALLLDEGAEASLRDPGGLTAAELATRAGYREVGHYLAQVALADTVLDQRAIEEFRALEPETGAAGWEPEQDFQPPESRQAPDESVLALQASISSHRARVDDDDWSSAEISLPATSSAGRTLVLPEQAVMILADAIASGWISGRSLRQAWPEATVDQRLLFRLIVQQTGVRIVPGRLAATFLSRGAVFADRHDRELARAAISQLEDELNSLAAAERYIVDVRSYSAFSPEREQRIFMKLEQSRKEVTDAVKRCLHLLGGIETATTPDESVDEPEEPDNVTPMPGADVLREDTELPEADAGAGTLPYEALFRAVEKAGIYRHDPAVVALSDALEKYCAARNRAMEGGLKLVPWIARKYSRRGLPLDDLVQEGNLGLMRAVEKFDPLKGARFGTYASFWIRQRMLRAVDDQSRVIRLPVHLGERLKKIMRLRDRSRAEFNRDATVAEVAQKIEGTPDIAKRLLNIPATVSRKISDRVADETVSPPDRRHDAACLRRLIAGVLAQLSPRSERVIRLRFGLANVDEHTLEEVGDLFEVTRERIRQIEAKAIKVLRHPNRSSVLQPFL
ncbi:MULTISPECIES: sigma-70 family RNA polymerase sigma factor [unclassified Mesorhizobium]|uniref:sigma-70 family RNA polymerase sigma factor n=1 Tax=unclassified Mesorhizobium TaxID=325217 RepID=UPI0011292A22|nr:MULTISPECIES: sigma-70 family RNA polymerase sigma factor [unclassified Mesorhizobium]MCA0028755.1 sigma-70 family RNA polymerase sigma factor [Mesorhizobium sp. B263B1A]TPJ86407.1 sigma-70 family RNA polymerase sigma factor [Mesorhizobium sp. B2-5-12]TPK21851.1 sigma-70 family RNA polymerase sigma factor [Mesorhizobium sp. B2-5-6]